MKRQEANMEIIESLTELFRENPDLRFFQGLHALNLFDVQSNPLNNTSVIMDNFYEESEVTLNKIR